MGQWTTTQVHGITGILFFIANRFNPRSGLPADSAAAVAVARVCRSAAPFCSVLGEGVSCAHCLGLKVHLQALAVPPAFAAAAAAAAANVCVAIADAAGCAVLWCGSKRR